MEKPTAMFKSINIDPHKKNAFIKAKRAIEEKEEEEENEENAEKICSKNYSINEKPVQNCAGGRKTRRGSWELLLSKL